MSEDVNKKINIPWSEHEINILTRYYPLEGFLGVSARISNKRSNGAIISKAFRLGIISNAPKKGHGMVGTRTYKAWYSAIQRCTNPKHSESKRYSMNGITICDRWRNSFELFLQDMGEAPTNKHVIDRIDPKKGYEPGNCRWATPRQNCANMVKKSNSKNPYKGISKLPSGKWRALINRTGAPRHVGVFDTPTEAAIAYDIEAIKEFGEFAMTNKRLGLI